ncbi:glycosyltransferase family 2 protein [Plastoroseomonas arctica]|uniref:Glycosyltransferase family 2 protein n=1 Tax=Plastoroseomonas arctica TaxID=1509237 RepID=A0AAF1JZI8_9PROT|nr:glycosyltransferase family 2 protein [Plastoroseomonas arctica]
MARISIISPCFNEEENVEACHAAVVALFDPGGPLAHHEREHIFADNDSADGTVAILRRLAAGDARMKVILNARNFGPFRSNFNALRYATGDAVLVFLPVDLQDPPSMIPEMVRHWESGIEVVAGARTNREETFALRFSRGLFYRIVNTLSDFDIPENVGEFQLIDRKVWEVVVSHHDQYPYIRGIIASAGFRRLILPYTWAARKRGISKNNLVRLVDQAMNGIFAFTNAPMRLCVFLGAAIAALSMLYAILTVLLALFVPSSAPAGTQTIIVAIFFFAGVQLLFIGMLGEYITAIHAQVRRGPVVVERERINITGDKSPLKDATPE